MAASSSDWSLVATAPSRVRAALQVVTGAAGADVRQVVAQAPAEEPEMVRAALFAAAPLIVSDYSDGAAALALDWFEEIRDEARPRRPFTPTPIRLVTDDDVAAMIARDSEALLREIENPTGDLATAIDESMRLIQAEIENEIAAAFRDTITENAVEDSDAVGWRRFARPGACKLCRMLADRGAVYTESTARFAAHGAVMGGNRKGGNCMCIAGPAYGGKETWAEATPMQYLASRRQRSAADRERLREYLNENFPEAPG